MTREQLAATVLQLLDMQKDYFRTKSQDLLTECKKVERHLRKKCDEILHPQQEQPGLFENPAGDKAPH